MLSRVPTRNFISKPTLPHHNVMCKSGMIDDSDIHSFHGNFYDCPRAKSSLLSRVHLNRDVCTSPVFYGNSYVSPRPDVYRNLYSPPVEYKDDYNQHSCTNDVYRSSRINCVNLTYPSFTPPVDNALIFKSSLEIKDSDCKPVHDNEIKLSECAPTPKHVSTQCNLLGNEFSPKLTIHPPLIGHSDNFNGTFSADNKVSVTPGA